MRLTSIAVTLILIVLVSTLNVPFFAVAPTFPSSYIDNRYGGADAEYAYSVAETDEGGFVLAGTTEPPDAGKADLWIVKTDANCVEQWTKKYGGSNDERGGYVIITSDGGFALAGFIISAADPKQSEIWLIKIDEEGNTQWNRMYGGPGLNRAFSLIQTSDGGYALAGSKYPSRGGSGDFFLIKTDARGLEQWSQTYGGAYWDEARSVIETADGGFALTGYTYSFGVNASISSDFWLVKTDKSGEMEWSQTYGGEGMDEACSVVQTVDGSYAIAGYTYSSESGNNDFWLVKTDSTGNILWSKTYGGENGDICRSMVATSEGGFALAGSTGSFSVEYFGFWLLVTDASGVEQRSEIYKRSGSEEARSLIQTRESKYVLVGSTYSSSDANNTDFWLVKTDSTIIASPTPTQEPQQPDQESYGSPQAAFEWNKQLEWSRNYRGLHGHSIVQNEDNGFTVTGAAESADEAVLLSLDSSGNELQRKNLPGNQYGNPVKFIAQMRNGGYVTIQNSYQGDCFLVMVDAKGNLQWNKTLISSPYFDEFLGVQTEDEGFAVAGGDSSTFQLVKTDQDGNVQWQQTYEFLTFGRRILIQTRDGGFLIGGEGHLAESSSGYSKFVIWKLDSAGNLQWAKEYLEGVVTSVAECGEGGYIVVGHESRGTRDQVWFLKVDSQGNMQWSRRATHSEDFANSHLSSVVQTRNGDFVAAGQWARSFAWVVKISSSGELIWSSVYGGVEGGEVFASAIIETDDGGFAFTGSGPDGEIWVAKIGPMASDHRDVVGLVFTEWSKTYGPLDGFSVIQTNDGGYAVAGQNATLGPYVFRSGRNYEDHTGLLVKVDSDGNEEWRRTYDSIGFDSVDHMVQTGEGGYALMGYSDRVIEGQRVFILAKTDSRGNIEWYSSFQGQTYLRLTSAIQTGDGGFAMAGWEELSSGVCFAWMFKIDDSGNLQWSQSFEKDQGYDPYVVEANDDSLVLTYRLEGVAQLVGIDAQGNTQWTMSYPDAWLTPFCLAKSEDGGYLLGGTRQVKTPFQELPWIVKTDANGNVEWQKAVVMDSRSYGEQPPGRFTEAIPTDDGGFILLSGNSASTYWIIKIDSSGNINWSQRLLGLTPVEYSANSVFICKDNGLILAGQAHPYGEDEKFVWLEKFAPVYLPEYPSFISDSLEIFLIFIVILIAIVSLVLAIFFLKRH